MKLPVKTRASFHDETSHVTLFRVSRAYNCLSGSLYL